jgi:hypothetical protein
VSGIYYGSFLIDAVVMVITIVLIVKEFKAVKAREVERVVTSGNARHREPAE